MSDLAKRAYIQHNDCAGVWQWSVSLASDPEYWLDSFGTLELALEFCRAKGLGTRSDHIIDRRR